MTRSRVAPVPPAAKPNAARPPRLGREWRWVRDTTMPVGHFRCDWQTLQSALGPMTTGRGTVTCNDRTIRLIESTDEGTDEFLDAREEAKRTMKAVMRDVSHLASTRPYGTVQPGRTPKMPSGIKALRDDVVALVKDMSAAPHPSPEQAADFAARYGRQRDAMKQLREAFAEAEGAFETAQALLLAQMED